MQKIYIIVDLESTCWQNIESKPTKAVNEIIEIGAVIIDDDGNNLGEFQKFVKPITSVFLSDFCKKLTSITQDDVEFEYSFPEVLEDFKRWYKSLITFGIPVTLVSWGNYDKNQLVKDCQLHKIDTGWILKDMQHISLKHLHGEWNKFKKPIGLGGACKFENLKFEGIAHRGIDDAKMVSKIFLKYLDKVNAMYNIHKFDIINESIINGSMYHHVVENSQFFDDLEQILVSLKTDSISKEYIITGLQNTINKGYKLSKIDIEFLISFTKHCMTKLMTKYPENGYPEIEGYDLTRINNIINEFKFKK